MTVKDIKIHQDIPFEEYLKLPGWSYSGIKNNGAAFSEPTEKMKLGTLVHNYLLEPSSYNYEKFDIVKPLALAVKQIIPPVLFEKLLKELAFSANFVHQGLALPYKGRIDLGVPGRIIIDLKVTEKLNIDYFGYDKQLSGYALGLKCSDALIIAIHPKTKRTSIHVINIQKEWWQSQIAQKGHLYEFN